MWSVCIANPTILIYTDFTVRNGDVNFKLAELAPQQRYERQLTLLFYKRVFQTPVDIICTDIVCFY